MQPAIITKFKWNEGRPVFEIPLNSDGPRCPVGGGTFYYTPDGTRCAVAADKTAASYLERRQYAQRIGVAVYSPDGIGHFEWQPQAVLQ